ncbi:hypothetical protein JQN72_08080 [Phycicoccus sp. CSK15P-2]|uniref:hypothetical protein n=1 Tax=Phycicoccus sp. CSK15P-2 TaxID=2807627 RepID=UPI00194E9B6E|nr:hypothetical protein [Phycicoccus sp. CSK15P-2]MBM6404201.1 hypothetical protein [Phycicoccus sp. CSK15P-2]
MESSGWVAVRCVFESEVDGTRTFEERVTIWRVPDVAAGIQLAENEALEYAEMVDASYTGLAQGYVLGDPIDHGAEVFSLMRDSDLATEQYLDRYFDTGAERQSR